MADTKGKASGPYQETARPSPKLHAQPTTASDRLQGESPFNEAAGIAERKANMLLATWCARGTAGCELDPDLFPTPRHRQMAHIVAEATAEGIRTWPDVLPRMMQDDQLRFAFLEAVGECNLPPSAQGGKQLAEHLRAFHIEKRTLEIGQQIAVRIESGEDWQDLRQQLEAVEAIGTTGSLAGKLAERAFDFSSPPPRPIPRLKLADKPLSTAGNLTNVQSPPKAGKSAVIDSITAATMCGNRQGPDTLGFSAENPHGHALIHLDTEQSRFDADSLVRRSIHRAMLTEPPAWFKSYCITDLSIQERRQALRHVMQRAAQEHGGIFAVLIDGIGDMCADPNDSEESFELVHELHTLAIRYDCTIVTVLHENPGSESGKTRGHLGSQLERKAETNLRLAKDAQGITTVWAERARHCHLPKDQGPCFAWSDQHKMHVSCGTAGEIKRAADRDKMESEVEKVFADGDSFRHTDLMTAAMEALDLKDRAAKLRVQKWTSEGIIRKDSTGKYRLSNP